MYMLLGKLLQKAILFIWKFDAAHFSIVFTSNACKKYWNCTVRSRKWRIVQKRTPSGLKKSCTSTTYSEIRSISIYIFFSRLFYEQFWILGLSLASFSTRSFGYSSKGQPIALRSSSKYESNKFSLVRNCNRVVFFTASVQSPGYFINVWVDKTKRFKPAGK